MTHKVKPGAAAAAHGLRGIDLAGRQISPTNNADVIGAQAAQSKHVVRAEIIGDDQASALGIAARGPAPVLKLCRLLREAGIAADMALEAYRGSALCLRIRSIAEGAAISVDEGRSAFCRWKAFPRAAVSPPMSKTGRRV